MTNCKNTVVYTLGNDISTDVIYPGRYMATVLPTETPQYAFADDPDFQARVQDGAIPAGSIIVGGENFGCGSSREQAVSTLKGHDLTIVAKGFARIFLQNAINAGLNVVTCPTIEAQEGNELDIGPQGIQNVTNGKRYTILPLPKASQEILDAGGLIPYTRERLKKGRP
ncbi:MAG: 3-isopropylmalate dehydratase small subunit [Nitrospirota bacterium]|nr:3-isopropylmalate dehydratase small subunit [Nitrospirota bacterium]